MCNGFPALFSVMCDVCVVQGVVYSGFPAVFSVQYILWVLCRGPCTAYSVFPAVFNVQCVAYKIHGCSTLSPAFAQILPKWSGSSPSPVGWRVAQTQAFWMLGSLAYLLQPSWISQIAPDCEL